MYICVYVYVYMLKSLHNPPHLGVVVVDESVDELCLAAARGPDHHHANLTLNRHRLQHYKLYSKFSINFG